MPFLGPLIAAGVGSLIAAATTTAFIATTAVSVGIGIITRLLSQGRSPRLEALDGSTSTIRSSIVNSRWVLGKARTPGVLCYFGSQGNQARMGLIIAEGPCERIDGQMWVDGKALQLDRATGILGQGDLLTPVATSEHHGKIEIREYFLADGSQGTHMEAGAPTPPSGTYDYDGQVPGYPGYVPGYGPIPTEFSDRQRHTDADGVEITEPFTTPFPAWIAGDHQLNGLSWVYVKLTQPAYGGDTDNRFWTRVPNLEFLVQGIKITWPGTGVPTWTDNAAALRYWWETERRQRDGASIDTTDFAAAYAACEQEVDLTAGVPASHQDFLPYAIAKRYTVNGVVSAGDDVSAVEDQFDLAWAGEVIEAGGVLRFRPGVVRPAMAHLVLGEQDIIEPPSVQPWPALQERVNAIDGEMAQSEAHEWRKLSLPKFRDQAAFARDGEERSGNIRVAYGTNPLSVGRLQAVNLRRARESLRMESLVTPGASFERLSLIPTDIVAVTNSEFGFVDKRMEVERVSIRRDWSVALRLREVLAGTYADTLVLPSLKPREIRIPDDSTLPDVEGLAADEIAEVSADGSILVRLHVTWTSTAREAEVATRLKAQPGDADAAWDSGF